MYQVLLIIGRRNTATIFSSVVARFDTLEQAEDCVTAVQRQSVEWSPSQVEAIRLYTT